MKLIFIYGPPAIGKLTVANELAKITPLKVFHGQMIIDLMLEFFEFGSKGFREVMANIRASIIELAAKQNLPGLIFTCCYHFKKGDKALKMIIRKVEKHGGTVHFVRLVCSKETLILRVCLSSRKKHKKITSSRRLEEVLKEKNLMEPILFVKSLEIDNTKLSAKEVAKKIKKHYRL